MTDREANFMEAETECMAEMEHVLTIDVGNTNIVLGLFEGDVLLQTARLETHRKWTEQNLSREIGAFLRRAGRADGAILSSVVPDLNGAILEAVRNLTGKGPLVMSRDLDTGLNTDSYDVSLLGSDRIVDMAAAIHFYGAPAAVYDLGTCTTLSVVDGQCRFIGGMISAGIQLSLDAQAERTAQLPQLNAEPAAGLLGQDTVSNLISGAVAGTGILIEGTCGRIRQQYGMPDMKVVITGGNAPLVLPWIRQEVVHDPDLLVRGMLAIYRKNRI